MKKTLLISICLLLLSSLAFGQIRQNNYYWSGAVGNNNFNDPSNWTTGPNGTGALHNTPPKINDDVYFGTNITSDLTLKTSGTINMRSLYCTAPAKVRLAPSIHVRVNIGGNVESNGNFSIKNTKYFTTAVYFVDSPAALITNCTIDLGTNDPIPFGQKIYIQKEKGSLEVVGHDFNVWTEYCEEFVGQHRGKGGAVLAVASSFKANNKNVVLRCFNVGKTCIAEIGNREIDLQGSTLKLMGTGLTYQPQLGHSSFNTLKATYKTELCDLVSHNSYVFFDGKESSELAPKIFKFKNVEFHHPEKVTIHTRYTFAANEYIGLGMKNLTIDCPVLEITPLEGVTVDGNRSQFAKLDVSGQLTFQSQGELFFDNNEKATPIAFNVMDIALGYTAGCHNPSTIKATCKTTLTATGVVISTNDNINYLHMEAAGAGINASANSNMGLNTGAFNWQSASGKSYWWVGGDGEWSDPTMWSVAGSGQTAQGVSGCTPGALDNVIVDNQSFSADGQSIHMESSVACKNILWTDPQRRGSLVADEQKFSIAINGNANFRGVSNKGVKCSVFFLGNENHTIESNSEVTYNSPYIIFYNTGTYTLVNDFVVSAKVESSDLGLNTTIFHRRGSFISNGKKIVAGAIESEREQVDSSESRTLDLSGSEVFLSKTSRNVPSFTLLLNAEGLTYDFTDSHITLITKKSNSYVLLGMRNGSFVFNDFTISDSYSGPHHSRIGYRRYKNSDPNAPTEATVSFNKLELKTDFTTIMSPFSIFCEELLLTPSKTYIFSRIGPLVVNKKVDTHAGECGEVRLSGWHDFEMKFNYANPVIEGAKISGVKAFTPDVDATNVYGATKLKVVDGVDLGGNTNVEVNEGVAKAYYWIGGSGGPEQNVNWSNPKNWSTSSTATTADREANTNECVPKSTDDVFFTKNSFSAIDQKVILDISSPAVHDMIWKSDVQYNPTFTNKSDNPTDINFKIGGGLEFTENMSFDFVGQRIIEMGGTKMTEGEQYLDTKGIMLPFFIKLNGGGRYDLRSDCRAIGNLYCYSSSFYTNGYDIRASSLDIRQGVGDVINLENSEVKALYTSISVADCDNWHTKTANIKTIHTAGFANSSDCSPEFGILTKGTGFFKNYDSNHPIVAKKIISTIVDNPESLIAGYFVTDSLIMTRTSAVLRMAQGSVMQINEGIKGKGTPCDYNVMTSVPSSSTDTYATIRNGTPGRPLVMNYFKVENVIADISNGCTSEDYIMLGVNNGGGDNFTYLPPKKELIDLGEQVLYCYDYPYKFGVPLVGDVQNYFWVKDEEFMDPQPTSTYIDLNLADVNSTYELHFEYSKVSGASCEAYYQKKFISDMTPDSDADGIPDACDSDDDNDGILDTDEGYCDHEDLPITPNSGSGQYNGQLLFFDWAGKTLNNGSTAEEIVDGVKYTATISEVSIKATGGNSNCYESSSLNTSAISSLYSSDGVRKEVFRASCDNGLETVKAKVTVVATKDGLPYTGLFDIVGFDAGGTTLDSEVVEIESEGHFQVLENIGAGAIATGLGTRKLTISETTGSKNSLFVVEGRNELKFRVKRQPGGNQAFGVAVRLWCDTDLDGISNRLDLDSDNDDCLDALEGGTNDASDKIDEDKLTSLTASSTLKVGDGSNAVEQNLCSEASCVDSDGVPRIVNADGTQGQEVGLSQAVMLVTSPSSLEICGGELATFTSTVTIDATTTGTMTYEWQMFKDDAWSIVTVVPGSTVSSTSVSGNITSGTVISLEISNVAEFADGSRFRVVYKEANGLCEKISEEAVLSVLPLPIAFKITGDLKGCMEHPFTLTAGTTGLPIEWSSSNEKVATISDLGVVTPVAPGFTDITYRVEGANGCKSYPSPKHRVSIFAIPVAKPITGDTDVCVNATIDLTEGTLGTIVWSSSDEDVATVDADGIVTGVSAGTVSITYTVTDGENCESRPSAAHIVTVNPLPVALAIAGDTEVCEEATITLTPGTSGTIEWESSDTNVATVDTNGVVTGVSGGEADITYKVTDGNSCQSLSSAIHTVTVNPLPVAADITGPAVVCKGQTVDLTEGTTGLPVVWSSSNEAIATVDASGVVTGVTPGVANITYRVTSPDNCGSKASKEHAISVLPLPVAKPITGDTDVCVNATIDLTEGTSGTIVWSSSDEDIATVDEDGIVTGVSAGSVNITYTVTDGQNCESLPSAAHIVTVNALPIADPIVGDTEVCVNETIDLTEGTLGTIEWESSNPEVARVDRNGVVTGVSGGNADITYKVTDGNSCQSLSSAIHTVTVNPLPVAADITGPTSVCNGSSVTLTAGTLGVAVEWSSSNPAVATVDESGVVTGKNKGVVKISYKVTDVNGCVSLPSNWHLVSVNALPVAKPIKGENELCEGNTIDLTAGTLGLPIAWSSSDEAIARVDANGVVTGVSGGIVSITYTVTDGVNCESLPSAAHIVTVNALPIADPIVGDTEVCEESTITLTPGTSGTIEWESSNPAVARVDANGVVTGVSAGTADLTYKVTDGNSCQSLSSAIHTVTVNALPTVSAGANQEICLGEDALLLADGDAGVSFAWDHGVMDGTYVSPTETTIYTVTGTGINGCTRTSTVEIKVLPLPTISGGYGGAKVYDGDQITLSGRGAGDGGSYTWDNGVTDGVPFTPPYSPVPPEETTTTKYTVIGTDINGCENTASIDIVVYPKPPVVAKAKDNRVNVCDGESVTLYGEGDPGMTYTWKWDKGVENNVEFVPPIGENVYTLKGTNSDGAENTASITVTVTELPTVTVVGGDKKTICLGESVALEAAGGVTYTWVDDSGNLFADGDVVSPTKTTVYTVVGEDVNGCENTASVTITVREKPNISAGEDIGICDGYTFTLKGSGGKEGTYTWVDEFGNVFTDGDVVSPEKTTTYTVIGEDDFGCSNTASVTVTLSSAAEISAGGPYAPICEGESVTLTASGGISYEWVDGVSSASYTVSPTTTTTYTVIGTYGGGCTDTATVTIVVNPKPDISIADGDRAICLGEEVTLTAIGGIAYKWDNGVTDANNTVTPPLGKTTYTVTGEDALGCKNTASVTITVTKADVTAKSNSLSNIFYDGDQVILTGEGAETYIWDDGTVGELVFDASYSGATTSKTYTVTGTDANGCTDTATITITIKEKPEVLATADNDRICFGEKVTLMGEGAVDGKYTWNKGVVNGEPFTPTETTEYTVTGEDVTGSMISSTITITVYPLPNISAGENQTICLGESVTLAGSGGEAGSYVWEDGITDGDVVTPTETTTYKVTGTDANGCTNTATVTITVTKPDVTATSNKSPNNVFYHGEKVILRGAGANTYEWDEIITDGVAFTPTDGEGFIVSFTGTIRTETYTVTGTDANGCTDTATITITIKDKPELFATTDDGKNLYCLGEKVTLRGEGAVDDKYTWDNDVVDGEPFTPPVGTTTYTVTGDTPIGKLTFAIDITVNEPPTVTAHADHLEVYKGEEVILTGEGASNYTWDKGVIDAQPFTLSETTTYTVTGEGTPAGCDGTATITITVYEELSVEILDADKNLLTCSDLEVVLKAQSSVKDDRVVFLWTTTDGHIVSGADTANPTVDAVGIYTVKVSFLGHEATADVEVKGDITPPNLNITWPDDLTCADIGHATIEDYNSEDGITYSITPQAKIEGAEITGLNYDVDYTVSALDLKGCVAEFTFNIPLECKELCKDLLDKIRPSQIVSPNGDEYNATWEVYGLEAYTLNCTDSKKNTIALYNRWGSKVYERNNYMFDEDRFVGYSENNSSLQGDRLLPPGTYFYIIQIGDEDYLSGFFNIVELPNDK